MFHNHLLLEQAQGYPNQPGIFNQKQILSWKKVNEKIHEKGSLSFCQLFHAGRVSHKEINGNVEAQNELGKIYNNGIQVKRDEAKALHCYKIAANNGNSNAQYMLGVYYEHGNGGLKQDFKKSLDWYQLAKENGNYDAYKIVENKTNHFNYTRKLYSNKLDDEVVIKHILMYQNNVNNILIKDKKYDKRFGDTMVYFTCNIKNRLTYGRINFAKGNRNMWIAKGYKSSSNSNDI